MRETPLVTVVIPTWNRLPLIDEAVRSVIAQTYPHWELIIVDDGSTDGTADHLREFGESRLRVLPVPHCGHLGKLRNIGIAAGTGELIAFLDSDDLWLPQKLEAQVRALAESRAGWCYAGYDMIDSNGHPTPMKFGKYRPLSGRIVREVLTYQLTASITTLMIRRELFDAIGRFSEDSGLTSHCDQELAIRLALHADAVAVPLPILARMREHEGRMTRIQIDPHLHSARIFEVFLDAKPPADLAVLARGLWARETLEAGRDHLAAGRFAPAARLFGVTLMRGADLRSWARALARGLRDWLFRAKQT